MSSSEYRVELRKVVDGSESAADVVGAGTDDAEIVVCGYSVKGIEKGVD